MSRLFLVTVCVVAVSLTAIAGCGGGKAGTVTVSGLVTMDGAPLEGASVNFVSKGDAAGAASGLTNAEGKYSLMTTPGEYKVYISKWKGERPKPLESGDIDPVADMAEFEQGSKGPASLDQSGEMIPARFSDANATELSFTVPDGGSDAANFTNLTSK